jgi:hypothetical protein
MFLDEWWHLSSVGLSLRPSICVEPLSSVSPPATTFQNCIVRKHCGNDVSD